MGAASGLSTDISGFYALSIPALADGRTRLPVGPRGLPAVDRKPTAADGRRGDGTFTGPSRPTDAFIPYYQRTRHIFGDLKIEVFDAEGKLVDTVASSKHQAASIGRRGPCISKPPRVPPLTRQRHFRRSISGRACSPASTR